MSHKVELNGEEVEVFTADEVAARETAARAAVTGELTPKLTEAQKEVERVSGLLNARTAEFGQFRKLSDDQVAKLNVTELALYENQKLLAEANEKNTTATADAHKKAVEAAIRAKVGTNEDLFKKVSDMYTIVTLDDSTPEALARRVSAALGALGTTEPDLLAAAGFVPNSSFEPVKPANETADEGFGATPAGKAFADELGLIIEAPKK